MCSSGQDASISTLGYLLPIVDERNFVEECCVTFSGDPSGLKRQHEEEWLLEWCPLNQKKSCCKRPFPRWEHTAMDYLRRYHLR